MKQGRSGGGRRVRKGTNLRIKLKLDLEEIANGVEKKIKVKRYVACNTCGGNGSKNGTALQTCSGCQGTGQVKKVVNTMLGQMVSTSTCPVCDGEGQKVSQNCEVLLCRSAIKLLFDTLAWLAGGHLLYQFCLSHLLSGQSFLHLA